LGEQLSYSWSTASGLLSWALWAFSRLVATFLTINLADFIDGIDNALNHALNSMNRDRSRIESGMVSFLMLGCIWDAKWHSDSNGLVMVIRDEGKG
jgi:succinate dehydrogenase hydrophobic anchor subunit